MADWVRFSDKHAIKPLRTWELHALQEILASGHELEKNWSSKAPACLEILQKLVGQIALLETSDSLRLRRLSPYAQKLSAEMTPQHLEGILVPFERLSRSELRDDQMPEQITTTGIEIETGDAGPLEIRQTLNLAVIAENIRSAFNVGGIIRTAEALGLERAYLCGYTSTPDDAKTAQTCMGAQNHIAWSKLQNVDEAITAARAEGYSIVGLETAKGAESIGSFRWPERAAILVGNERFGLDPQTLKNVDHIARIPLRGRKNSVNVAIAFALAAQDYISSRHDPLQGSRLLPIGTFHCKAIHRYEARRQGNLNSSPSEGVIRLRPGQGFEQSLRGLSEFSRIWILFGFHHNASWKPMVMPPRGPRVKQGVFATRSPHRPNPLGLSSVELVSIERLDVTVRGFDLLDGSPVYDLKPYLPYADAFPEAKAGWAQDLADQAYHVVLTEQALRQLTWLEGEGGLSQIRGFLFASLEFDPTDDERKRVIVSSTPDIPHRLCYRTWRIEYRLVNEPVDRAVEVCGFSSGYSEADLADSVDTYGDKNLHRRYLSRFTNSSMSG